MNAPDPVDPDGLSVEDLIATDKLSEEALIALFLAGTQHQREVIASKLCAIIRRSARAVVHGRPVGPQFRLDFVEQMPAEVLEKVRQLAFDPEKGRFEAWCRKVLKHRYLDLVDQWARRCKRERPLPPGDVPGETSVLPAGICGDDEPRPAIPYDDGQRGTCRDEPFSGRELDLLQKMPRLQRVICISAAGWSPRVPAEVWQQWLAEVRIQPPFPPMEILDIDQPTKRLPLLAETSGKKLEGSQTTLVSWP